MLLEVQPLQPEDIPKCVRVYFDAFQNAHSLACWPRVSSIRKFWEDMLREEMDGPNARFLQVVAVANRDGEDLLGGLTAFAKWVAPKPGVEVDTSLPRWPEEADAVLCDRTFGPWARRHSELMGTWSHWYLELLATDPKYQGKGAGSLLLRYGCERADNDSVEAYLDASPESVHLYEKIGFEEAGRLDTLIPREGSEEGVWYRNLYMIKPSRPHGSTQCS